MAEGAPLLREYGLTLIEGSNPSLSAIQNKPRKGLFSYGGEGGFGDNPSVRQAAQGAAPAHTIIARHERTGVDGIQRDRRIGK